MHFACILYGARSEVERFMRNVESAVFQLKLTKACEEPKAVNVHGQIRELPFGIKEIVFPREYRDVVLNTVMGKDPNRQLSHRAYKPLLAIFRKALRLKKIPKGYDKTRQFVWDTEYVSIMPLGIREDTDLEEMKDMGYKGWNHEAI